MIYALKLLAAVFTLACVAAYLLRGAFKGILTPADYRKGWTLVLLGVVVSYLCVYPGVFLAALAGVMIFGANGAGRGPAGKVAIYLLLACTIPPINLMLGGVGGIGYILNIDHLRLGSMILLVWAAAELMGMKRPPRAASFFWIDALVVAYQLLRFLLVVPHSTVTTLVRTAVESLLDVLLPYFVVSRGLRSMEDFRFAVGYFLMGLSFVAAVGVGETLIQHNLYSGLQTIYDVHWQLTYMLMRGSLIRIQAVTPEPIILAFVMLFGLALAYWLKGDKWRRPSVRVLFGALVVAEIATFSRGPWLGAAIVILAIVAMRKMSLASFRIALVTLVIGGIVMKAAGADQQIVGALGAIFGSEQADLSSIEYRRELLDTALALIKQSPWTGVPNYAAQMQSLRQGEGIIDIVNSYVAIMLDAGVFGLAIYLLPFIIVFTRLHSAARRRLPGATASNDRFALTFAALILGCLFIIFTTSTWSIMTLLMTLLLALPVAWLGMSAEERSAEVQRADIELDIVEDPLLRHRPWAGGGLS